ncbi:MAG: DUF2027 domain-containing protein [Prolixibacteraceae bacterium]|nr:DUF2027 domain-containing protein [Prolixibacteraceae bacterium]
MFKIGDKVKFLNEVGGGTITKIIGSDSVCVESEDGFEIPVSTADILSAENNTVSYTKESHRSAINYEKQDWSSRKKENEDSDIPSSSKKTESGFFFGFLPEDSKNPLSGRIEVYLVNNSNFYLLYQFSHFNGKDYVSQKYGEMHPNSRVLLETISRIEINELPDYCFQIVYFKDSEPSMNTPFTQVVKINPVKFYKSGSFTDTGLFKDKAMLFDLKRNTFSGAIEEISGKDVKKVLREKDPVSLKINNPATPEIMEVDLHMKELLDNMTGLSAKEMLEYQMKIFKEKIEEAASSKKIKKIIFIHGLGNGVLKQKIRHELTSKYKKYPFQDASFREYGYGATMVILKR